MDTAPLFSLLSNITRLSASFQKALKENLGNERYKPHQILHAAGQLENRLYYLQSGLARNYYYDDHGNEHTVRFWEAGDILFSYEGYYKVPSYFYTEIIEHAELITISYNHLYDLDLKYPETAIIIKEIFLRFNREEYEKRKLIALPAEERYQILRKKKPGFFEKLPNRIIASYLHMTRETLTKFIGKR
jgi:CRP-like cAMP-binding protein